MGPETTNLINFLCCTFFLYPSYLNILGFTGLRKSLSQNFKKYLSLSVCLFICLLINIHIFTATVQLSIYLSLSLYLAQPIPQLTSPITWNLPLMGSTRGLPLSPCTIKQSISKINQFFIQINQLTSEFNQFISKVNQFISKH